MSQEPDSSWPDRWPGCVCSTSPPSSPRRSAATLLADYGADVLKVELPGAGDGARGFPPLKDGKALWWKVTNRNKRFITLDLRRPEGAALLQRMLPRFDVLIENFRPGTLDRWGLTREALWAIQPRLVILRVTGFGQTGPVPRPARLRAHVRGHGRADLHHRRSRTASRCTPATRSATRSAGCSARSA